MAWLSATSGPPPAALTKVETSHEVIFLEKSEEELLAEEMFAERAKREAAEREAAQAAAIAAARVDMGARVAALLNDKLAKSWDPTSSGSCVKMEFRSALAPLLLWRCPCSFLSAHAPPVFWQGASRAS